MESKVSSATTINVQMSGRAPIINTPQSGDSTVSGRCSPSPLLRSAFSNYRPESVDTRDQGAQIKHGILPDYCLRAKTHIHGVLFDPKNQSSTVHHSKGVSMYQRRKSEKDIEHDEKSRDIVKLLHASKYGLYVGVCKSCLKLLNAESFECSYVRESEARIISAVFNSWSGEVLTSGPGNITIWIFRQGAKVIAPSQVITDGLESEDEVGLLHLEDVPGKAQRCFASVGTGVRVFLLSSGKLLNSLPDLHSVPISALMFFRPLRLVVTASKDGAIKVWDSSWDLVCTFVSHGGCVTSLVPYPYGPMIISGSSDATIRVWNLATHDQVEVIDHTIPVEGLHSEPGSMHLLSFSTRQVKVWRVQQLYTQTALTGNKVHFLTSTTHPKVPLRILASCADSAVRVVSPVMGDVITTALLPIGRDPISLAYFSFQEDLYVLDELGEVAAFNTRTNPALQTSTWSYSEELGPFTCLALYETAMDEDEIEELVKTDRWLNVMLEARRLSRHRQIERDPLDARREGYSLLLAGTQYGYLVLLDPSDGSVKYSVRAHGSAVSLIRCNPKKNQVITTSQDSLVHVWELYPHIEEVFSLMFSFGLSSPPSLMVVTQERVGVARNDPEHSAYSIEMFHLADQTSYTGQAEDSHTDTITALDASPKLKLFASCSKDCTVRIWTEDNHPVRVLQLDCAPEGLVFCSQQADIMIALHTHLHTISNTTYMPESLQKQMVSIQFSDAVGEGSLEWSVKLASLPHEDRLRLELIDNTISKDAYQGALSEEEMASLEQAARDKSNALALIEDREREIRAIRDGQITSKRQRAGLKGREKEQMWKELLKILRPDDQQLIGQTIVIPEQDDFDPDTYGRPVEVVVEEPPYEVGPRYKFFPPLATFDPPYPIAPDGYLPNSVVLSKLRKSQADQELAKAWKPPSISDKQRKLMEQMEEEEEIDEEEPEHDADLMARLQAAMARPETPPTPSPPPTPTPPPTPPQKKVSPRKPIQKLVAPKGPPKPPTLPPRSPTPPPPPKSPTPPPTPPPPPTPLPEYIAQFIGERWFEKLFPNATSKTFPRPWTVTRFIFTLLPYLEKPLIDSTTKADICAAILKLLQQHDPSYKDDIIKAVVTQLTSGSSPPSPARIAERRLVEESLKLLFHLNALDSQLTVMLMVYYIEGDDEFHGLILDYLIKRGLEDPLGYFARALNDLASLEQGQSPGGAVGERGRRGGRGKGGQVLPSSGSLALVCREWLEEWAEKYLLAKAPKLLKSSSPAKKSLKSKSTKKPVGVKPKVSFSHETGSPSHLPPYDPILVINYYVEVEYENELARRRVVTPPPAPPSDLGEELPHNTIVSLPKINKQGGLIRLGETHCSCCHPERETSLALYHRLPPLYNTPNPEDPAKLWRQFTHCITLALKPQNINPFLTEEERRAEQEMEGLRRSQAGTMASIMKYFVPERSYVRTVNE